MDKETEDLLTEVYHPERNVDPTSLEGKLLDKVGHSCPPDPIPQPPNPGELGEEIQEGEHPTLIIPFVEENI
jgi:hypothetical protein